MDLIRFYYSNELPGGGKLVRGSTRPKWLLKHSYVTQKEKLGAGNFCGVSSPIFHFPWIIFCLPKAFTDIFDFIYKHFSAVYRGVIARSGEEVAIKICHDDQFKAMESLLDEARVMAKIDHPNIIKFIGLCCDTVPVMVGFTFPACDWFGTFRSSWNSALFRSWNISPNVAPKYPQVKRFCTPSMSRKEWAICNPRIWFIGI